MSFAENSQRVRRLSLLEEISAPRKVLHLEGEEAEISPSADLKPNSDFVPLQRARRDQSELDFWPFCPQQSVYVSSRRCEGGNSYPKTTVLSQAKSVPTQSKGPLLVETRWAYRLVLSHLEV